MLFDNSKCFVMGHIGVALLNDPTNIAKAKESFTDTETKNNSHQNFSSQK